VAAGDQARFSFEVIEPQAVAYSVESAVSSWCRLLLPAGHVGGGELVVDVPSDAGPGRYALRLVATASGQEIAAANVMLHITAEARPGTEPCLKVLPAPKFDLQPDGTVVVTLQVVNCGNVDATLVLRARHEDGWSFSVDESRSTSAPAGNLFAAGYRHRDASGRGWRRPPLHSSLRLASQQRS
jgi:hypothetical protein